MCLFIRKRGVIERLQHLRRRQFTFYKVAVKKPESDTLCSPFYDHKGPDWQLGQTVEVTGGPEIYGTNKNAIIEGGAFHLLTSKKAAKQFVQERSFPIRPSILACQVYKRDIIAWGEWDEVAVRRATPLREITD